MTTVAIGFCTSAPAPVAMAMGTKPSEATSAVIATGRSRSIAPRSTASSRPSPSPRSCLMWFSMTRPFSTATPESAMKPTAAEIEKGMPRSHSRMTPPVSASGTAVALKAAAQSGPWTRPAG